MKNKIERLRTVEVLSFLIHELGDVIKFAIGISLLVIFICGLVHFSYQILISELSLFWKVTGVALEWMMVYILFFMEGRW